jgi:ABC-type hemin transport system substrate-binding protein
MVLASQSVYRARCAPAPARARAGGWLRCYRITLLALLGSLLLAVSPACSKPHVAGSAGSPRIVSLSPPLTETLFYLGAGASVVGVSDYCRTPAASASRPRVGTSMRPDYERIVLLAPTLIVTEMSMTTDRAQLQALAPTELLPWLTLDEVVSSIRRLGTLARQPGPAERLALLMSAVLSPRPAPDAPRVLLVIYGSSKLDEVLFVRDNSLHGAVLRAAGASNAVEDPVNGVPRMSLEALIRLDPPSIVVLADAEAGAAEAIAAPWHRLTPLTAVRSGRLAVIAQPNVFGTGPSILGLVERLARTLAQIGARG